MKHLILLIALISFSANAQNKMVLIEGFDKQEITVTDSVSDAARANLITKGWTIDDNYTS